MARKKLLIVGAGGHGRSVAEAATLSQKYEVIGFADDSTHSEPHIWGIPIMGPTSNLGSYRHLADEAIVAIGNNGLREALLDRLDEAGFTLATVIHPQAIVSPSATLGPGSAVMAGAILGTEAAVGRGAIVNSGAVVDHHAQVHNYGHLGVNACMAGGAILGRGAWIQAGCSLGYGVVIEPKLILPPGTALPQQGAR